MGYIEWASPAPLRAVAVCLWSRTVGASSTPALILPDGCVDLIWQSGTGAYLAGPDTGPMPATLPAAGGHRSASPRPGAGGTTLGVPLESLQNLRADLADLRPESARRLRGDLDPDEALRRMVTLIGELAGERPPDPAMLAAVRLLDDPHLRVPELAAKLGLSDRQLRRRFTAAVGYGPKTMQRVLRFQRFLRLLGEGTAGELAARAGYVDQAHLTRESTALAGQTPAALIASRTRTGTRR